MMKLTHIDLLRHDLEKPRAAVMMFFDLFDDISKDPEKVEFWKNNILKSFDQATERLKETTRLLGEEK